MNLTFIKILILSNIWSFIIQQKVVMAYVGKAKGTVIAIVIVFLDWYATMIGGGKTTTVKQV